jgi:hypothetical protein
VSPPDEIALQFTVNEKLSEPKAFEAPGASMIPKVVDVDGVQVPTDVSKSINMSWFPGDRLSNWHVLQTASGAVADDVVQP